MSERADDGIEELLRATGRRPAPPLDRSARVREAVRAHWRLDRRRRLRRRVLWVSGSLAAATAAFATLFVLQGTPGEVVAHIARAEPPSSFHAGDTVPAGATLATGESARLAVRLISGDAVRLDRRSRVRIVSSGEIALEVGALYVDTAGASTRLVIETPFGRLEDRGTQFLVRLSRGRMHLLVREGAVALHRGADRVVVEAGYTLTTDGRRSDVRREAPGRAWAWAEEIAPWRVIEGRSAREFLDWVAHEKGLSLRFDTPEAAAAASTVTLRGSVEGMTLDEALDSVLPTCGMVHRIEGGVLRVGARP